MRAVLETRAGPRLRAGRPGRIRLWPAGGRTWPDRVGPDLLSAISAMLTIAQADRRVSARLGSAGRLGAAQDELLGLVSHELRTPVTTIYGNAQLLLARSSSLTAGERQMVDDIAEDSDRLLGLVDNLLLLARMESGTPPYREPLLLTHQLRAACAAFGEQHRRDVAFRLLGGADVVVDTDRVYLAVLVRNLLANADMYSPPDAKIEVLLEQVGREAHVSILDRGIGLGADAVEHLAAPFFRGLQARRIASGIGLGLTVCARIVEIHGGRLWARARAQGGGADVGFALPLMGDPGA